MITNKNYRHLTRRNFVRGIAATVAIGATTKLAACNTRYGATSDAATPDLAPLLKESTPASGSYYDSMKPDMFVYSPRQIENHADRIFKKLTYEGHEYHHAILVGGEPSTLNKWRTENVQTQGNENQIVGKTWRIESSFVVPPSCIFGDGPLSSFTFTQFHDSKFQFPDGSTAWGSPCFAARIEKDGSINVVNRWGDPSSQETRQSTGKRFTNIWQTGERVEWSAEFQYHYQTGFCKMWIGDRKILDRSGGLGFLYSSGCNLKTGIYRPFPNEQIPLQVQVYNLQNLSLEVLIGRTTMYAL